MSEFRGLLVDYGGVLTTPLEATMARWVQADGIDRSEFASVLRRWSDAVDNSPVHDLETGRLSVEDFEILLAAELSTSNESPLLPAGLLQRMLGGFQPEPSMIAVVDAARAGGIRTGLLSNSWGLTYPREGWDRLFDVVVISGEVGLRKPEPAIYLYAAEQLGLAPAQCVFIDDLEPNIRGAELVGMAAIHHTDVPATLEKLQELFGRSFA